MERSTLRRYEKRCFCGNVIAYKQEKEPKKYECAECGRTGKWDEVFEYPKVDIKEYKQEEMPAPVFLEGKPHFVIDNQYVTYEEVMLKILKRRVAKDMSKIKEIEAKLNIKNPGDKE